MISFEPIRFPRTRVEMSWVARGDFGGKTRREFYEVLLMRIDGGDKLIDAVEGYREVIEIAVPIGDGVVSRLKREAIKALPASKVMRIVSAIIGEISAGAPLSEALAPVVPPSEMQLIRAAERSGDVAKGLEDVIEELDSGSEMIGAVLGGVAYPALLLVALYHVTGIFATRIVPAFARMSDPGEWEGAARAMYVLCDSFNRYGQTAALSMAVFAGLTVASLPFAWPERFGLASLRVFLDRYVPPFSIYRAINGGSFLKSMSSQVKAGVKVRDVLIDMAQTSTPWQRERLYAISYGVARGKPLGEAMLLAGHNFPDYMAIRLLKGIGNRSGFGQAMYRFALRWNKQTLARVKLASAVFFYAAILTFGVVGGVLVSGMMELQDAIQERTEGLG